MPLPHFIEMDGDPQIPPPYVFKDVFIRSFRLPADLEVLTVLCDKLLNIGTFQERGFEYRPILPYVDLEVLTYPSMVSRNPRFYAMGYCRQHEAYFRLLVGRFEIVAGYAVPVGVAVFMPYLFVDNAWSVISGRQVVGYPKVLGKFVLGEPGPYPITITTDVFERYIPDTLQRERPLVQINQTGPPQGEGQGVTTWPWGVLDLQSFWPPLTIVLDAALRSTTFFTMQLKQIRDAESPQRACYQALVQAEVGVSRMSAARLLPSAEINIARYDSLPISEELGLGSGALRPRSQYALTCDMEVLNTTNVFVRP